MCGTGGRGVIVAGVQREVAHAELAFEHQAFFVTLMRVFGQTHAGPRAQQKGFCAGLLVATESLDLDARNEFPPALRQLHSGEWSPWRVLGHRRTFDLQQTETRNDADNAARSIRVLLWPF